MNYLCGDKKNSIQSLDIEENEDEVFIYKHVLYCIYEALIIYSSVNIFRLVWNWLEYWVIGSMVKLVNYYLNYMN